MEYNVLVIGLPDKITFELKSLIFRHQYDIHFTSTFTTQEASRMLNPQMFHLLIADLDYLRSIQQADC